MTFELIRTISALFLRAIESIYANDKERIDIVIYLNGFAIITIELKCNFAGQSADDAIYQYRMERDSKSRLFLFKAGVLVNFTMDLHEVYMTTMLDKDTIARGYGRCFRSILHYCSAIDSTDNLRTCRLMIIGRKFYNRICSDF